MDFITLQTSWLRLLPPVLSANIYLGESEATFKKEAFVKDLDLRDISQRELNKLVDALASGGVDQDDIACILSNTKKLKKVVEAIKECKKE